MNIGLCYRSGKEIRTPVAYVDADLAENDKTWKSISGYYVIMGEAAVSWYARNRELVAVLSTEAK